MSLDKNCFILLVINILSIVSRDGVSVTASDPADERTQSPSLSPAAAVAAAQLNSVDIKPALDSFFPLSLLSSFAEDPEISDYCRELLHIFGQRYFAYVNCLVPAARPVKVCQNCFSSYGSLVNIYANISSESSANVSCRDKLLRSDRLMLVYLLYSNSEDVWSKSNCKQCITKELPSLTNDTLYFVAMLNQTLTCFEKYKQGNHSEICKNCNGSYKGLNELYGKMEKNQSLCIDLEDAMNMTRIMWSTIYNCSVPREETVPIIAVSSFMLFLPIIFYLSSFLHSEQKKRKLIHPKRAKSYSSLMNIQDKLN